MGIEPVLTAQFKQSKIIDVGLETIKIVAVDKDSTVVE